MRLLRSTVKEYPYAVVVDACMRRMVAFRRGYFRFGCPLKQRTCSCC